MTKSKNQIEEEVLPGIGLLSASQRQEFSGSEFWYSFNKLVNELVDWYNPTLFFTLNFSEQPQQKIQQFLAQAQHSKAYANFIQLIIKEKLIRFYPPLAVLSQDDLQVITNTDYSNALFLQVLDEQSKKTWINEFRRDKTPAIQTIFATIRIEIIRNELKKSYPYYFLLDESEQLLLAKKNYSSTIFLSYSTSSAKKFWLLNWRLDDSPDALRIKEKERLYESRQKLEHFYSHYSYLDEHEQSLLANLPYSITALTKQHWLNAFCEDNTAEIVAIKQKEKIRISVNKIKEYYPEWFYLSNEQLVQLASTWYSQKLLTHPALSKNDWRQLLEEDRDEVILTLKKTVKDNYHYHLGNLFKKDQPDWPIIVADVYSQVLAPHEKYTLLINRLAKDWTYQDQLWAAINYTVEHSLMYFIKSPLQNAKKYVDDIANAHAVYRFFGMSSDNIVFGLQFEVGEKFGAVPVANVLDLLNYHRSRKSIAEGLSILNAFSIPLKLFFEEYFEIGRFEKNPVHICIRAFIPFVVMSALLTLGYSLVLPLAIHVFLEYLLFIPSVYLSLAGASLYLHVRNEVYSQFMSWLYNGKFNSPLFLANQRLKMAFREEEEIEVDESVADRVSRYYAEQFQECEQMEALFLKNKTLMDSDELKRYKHYSIRKFQLYIEWYDIHERTDVPIDEIPKIVQNRLTADRIFLLKNLRERHEEYVSSYTKDYATFFGSKTNKALREECDYQKKSLLKMDSLVQQIDETINVWNRSQHHAI